MALRNPRTLFSLLSFFCCIYCALETPGIPNKKPNIVFIMADDLGWNDVGFHNSFVKTPNIDQLAKDGIELTSHYSQTMCGPSRAALLTGRYPSNTGLHQAVVRPRSKNCLPLELKVIPQYMKEAGYVTKYVGKWHLGYCSTACLPTSRGFDEFRGTIDGHTDYFNWYIDDQFVRFVNESPSFENLGTHMTLMESMDVIDMIETHSRHHSEDPLLLIYSPTAPHSPVQVTDDMLAAYGDSLAGLDQSNRKEFLSLVTALDTAVGDLIWSLKASGMYENTVIIFTSDNGGTNLQILPFLPANGNNYPLRGQKMDPYEGGVKVPTIYFDPRLPESTKGTSRDFLMHITDWLPTFLGFAYFEGNIDGELDGISQLSNLGAEYDPLDKYEVRSEMLIHLTDLANFFSSNCSNADVSYRMEDWKLIFGEEYINSDGSYSKPAEDQTLPDIVGETCLRMEDNITVIRCLFNLKEDPYEQHNLFDLYPNITRKLMDKINHFERIRAQATFMNIQPVTDYNSYKIDDVYIPKLGYCDAEKDFPLTPFKNADCKLNHLNDKHIAAPSNMLSMSSASLKLVMLASFAYVHLRKQL